MEVSVCLVFFLRIYSYLEFIYEKMVHIHFVVSKRYLCIECIERRASRPGLF